MKNKVFAVLTTAAVAVSSVSGAAVVGAAGIETADSSVDLLSSPSAVEVPEANEDAENTEVSETAEDAENTESSEVTEDTEKTESSEAAGDTESAEGTKVSEETEKTDDEAKQDIVSYIKANYTELRSFTATIPFGAPLDLKDFYIGLEGYSWAVEDTEHFIMTSDGLLTMVERGYTTAYAYDSGAGVYYSFSIVPRKSSSSDSVDEINNTSTIEIKVNQTKDLYSYVDRDVIASAYTWSTEDDDICEVTRKGIIKGIDDGDTYVKAYYYDSSRSYKYKFHVYVEGSSKYSSKSKTSSGTSSVVNSKKEASDEESTSKASETKKVSDAPSKPVSETKRDYAAEAAAKFTDISHRAWALEAIGSMVDKGFIVGVSEDTFLPDNNCTRADFSIVVSKMFSLPPGGADNYSDVSPSDYFSSYTARIKAANADAGVFEGNFRPRDYITREEAFTFVYKALLSTGKQVNVDQSVLANYSDADRISSGEYRTAIAALLNERLITGTSIGIEPDATITRAQMAVLLDNVYKETLTKG